MSNTKKRTNGFQTWDEMVAEVGKPDYQFPTPDGSTILIKEPNGQQLMDAQEMSEDGNIKEQLRVLCGDAADDVIEVLKVAPGSVMIHTVRKVMAHFKYDAGEA